MESSMVNQNIELIKDYFFKHLPMFEVEKEAFQVPFWYISLRFNEIRIIIDGDIGFAIVIELYNSKYDLWQHDKSIIDKMKTTNDNILYQLSVLKSFLDGIL